jgi:hypothetical protein
VTGGQAMSLILQRYDKISGNGGISLFQDTECKIGATYLDSDLTDGWTTEDICDVGPCQFDEANPNPYASVQVPFGYQLDLYSGDNFTGDHLILVGKEDLYMQLMCQSIGSLTNNVLSAKVTKLF